MALTRAFLRGLKLDEEQVSAIIEAHAETVDGLKAVQSDLADKLKAAEEKLNAPTEDWEQKYNATVAEFEAFKTDTAAKAARQAKEAAYRQQLIRQGVSEKRIDGIMRYDAETIDALELDEHGAIKDADAVSKGIGERWSDFITTTTTAGAPVASPPQNTGKAYTLDDIRGMSAAEINNNWEAVKASLRQS